MFFDDDGNEMETSKRYADQTGGGGFGNATRGLNEKSPSGRQAKANGRIRTQVMSSTNHQMSDEERAIAAMCNILDNTPTGARVVSGEPHRRLFGSNYIEFTYNAPHGLNDGQFEGMSVTRINDRTIRVSK